MKLSYYYAKLIKKLRIPAVRNSVIDKTAKVCSGSNVVDTQLGRYSYIGNDSTVVDCRIGNFCSISDNCVIGGMTHPLDHVSTSPVMHAGRNCLKKNFSDRPYHAAVHTEIGSDVWIGAGCFIKGGVRLSDGCVIGMGSVVTKDVGPYEIWAGNPARMIRKRFDDSTVERLLKSEWWNWPDDKIAQYAAGFDDPAVLWDKD
jgi:acetyltransferase-like isoleucine patch superfamily enzyme